MQDLVYREDHVYVRLAASYHEFSMFFFPAPKIRHCTTVDGVGRPFFFQTKLSS